MQTFFGSVKNRKASSPPSRPITALFHAAEQIAQRINCN